MQIHHLNCGTVRIPGKHVLMGDDEKPERLNFVTHCLLLELASDDLIMVDTGISRVDLRKPSRIGRLFHWFSGLDCEDTTPAHTQIRDNGLDPGNVTDILVTHLDADHIAGLVDFPHATVHLLKDEFNQTKNSTWADSFRHPKSLWSHKPDWKIHTQSENADDWFGFDSIRVCPDKCPELRFIPLPGHTAGHTGVAAPVDDGWLLHCGDAYHVRPQLTLNHTRFSRLFSYLERLISFDHEAHLKTLQRLRDVWNKNPSVTLISSHDRVEYQQACKN